MKLDQIILKCIGSDMPQEYVRTINIDGNTIEKVLNVGIEDDDTNSFLMFVETTINGGDTQYIRISIEDALAEDWECLE